MKKKLTLKKETLMKLQEKQMKALVGGMGMSNSQYDEPAFNSCCKRSCNAVAMDVNLKMLDDSCCKRSC